MMAANNPNNKKRLKRGLKIYEVNIKHIRLMILLLSVLFVLAGT
jgi:hypothetical protein